MAAKGVDFAGKQGEGMKSRTETAMPTGKMGGKGKIESPVANFPTGRSNTAMPTGQVTGKTKIDSPVASSK